MSDLREQLIQICKKKMAEKGFSGQEKYESKLSEEIEEIDTQVEYNYFLDLYNQKIKFESNENNILIAYLLDLVDDFNIETPSEYIEGEFPDIDVDYLPEVRDYLKNEWVPKTFGRENVCSIGTYGTFHIKGAITDMARVHGKEVKEIQAITTKMDDKDEDGKPLDFDIACEMYPDFKDYCDENPQVADAAKRLLHRNRQMSTHAGGLIISKSPLTNLVPLVRGKEGAPVSSFVEGLAQQDLGPLGLIKFDLLIITDLLRIYKIGRLIKERHGIEKICGLEGKGDWSDVSYLNDSKAIKLANTGKLKGIFQFDGTGIQQLVQRAGINCFDDLVAITSLWRPGPLGMGMDETFIKRKNKLEKYKIHPMLKPVLKSTYGILIFQEQVMQILNVVGDIPLVHCEKVRKAISKKKEDIFISYKEMFIENGQKRLKVPKEYVENLWDQIESFASYGFNRSHAAGYTYISSMLLWLKAHYPLEFFAGSLSMQTDDAKIKEYKLDSDRFNIKIHRVDLNKSGWNFEIVNNEIYMGFSNIKGIGESVSQEIVKNQPYKSFEDFLNRFGTDAKVLKAFVALRLFDDADPAILWEFYEHYKKEAKKINDRDKRAEKSREKMIDEFKMTLKNDYQDKSEVILNKLINEIYIDEEFKCPEDLFEIWLNIEPEERLFNKPKKKEIVDLVKKICNDVDEGVKIIKKYARSIENWVSKKMFDKPIRFDDFSPTGEIDEKLKDLYSDVIQEAEAIYYGFGWDHMLEYSPDFKGGYTFDALVEDKDAVTGPVECQIVKKVEERESKKGNRYYVTKVEDANWKQEFVTIWAEDYDRFKEEFDVWDEDKKRGNMLCVKLEKPGPGFKSYTFDSPPKAIRHKRIPEDKKLDGRLIVLKKPEKHELEIEKKIDYIELN